MQKEEKQIQEYLQRVHDIYLSDKHAKDLYDFILLDVGLPDPDEGEFEVRDEVDMIVSVAIGPYNQAHKQACHYLHVYGQDGPVRLVEVRTLARIGLYEEDNNGNAN